VCLIQEELDREPIELSNAELQHAMDGFRRAHKLYTANATRTWLERRGITQADLEELVGDEAIVARLRQRVTEGRVEAYFETHQSDFDTANIARLAFSTEAQAQAASELVSSGAVNFYTLAQQQFVASCYDGQVRIAFDMVQRRGTPQAVADAILSAGPGEVVGPVIDGDAYVLALVLSRSSAQLDARTRSAVERVLFEQWLAERRARADIEWYWWNSARTQQAARPPAAA
jgi:putative peptide maturation system protein